MTEIYLLFWLAIAALVGYGVYIAGLICVAVWRGDPHARILKRRRKYLKKVRA